MHPESGEQVWFATAVTFLINVCSYNTRCLLGKKINNNNNDDNDNDNEFIYLFIYVTTYKLD